MRLFTKAITKKSRTLAASVATLIISGLMMSSSIAADIPTLYENSCAACHNSGALGAIKKGDSAAWNQLIQQKGMPTLIKSVKGGMIQMPAGGLCNDCNDEDYRKLIDYMSK